MPTMSSPPKKNIIVLGAGVVGLTSAIHTQESYLDQVVVSIVAEILPSDERSIRYTSHWAGAHHVSLAGNDERQQKMDQETFCIMWKMSEPGSKTENCFLRIPQKEFYHESKPSPNPLSWMPNFKELPKDELPSGCVAGISFDTITIDIPVYLKHLESRFIHNGGTFFRGSVQHINDVLEGGAQIFSHLSSAHDHSCRPDAVLVCTGLGTRNLGGIEDKTMYPIRGQTLVIKAPWIKFGRTISSASGLWTYIIPRRSGDVIVGGTKVEHDWFPVPRPEISADILKRGFALAPELAPPDGKAPSIDAVKALIQYEGCGLRPGRPGGIRLEVELFDVPNFEAQVPVVYNYGHAGWGYQSSWGSASMAVDLLAGTLGLTKCS